MSSEVKVGNLTHEDVIKSSAFLDALSKQFSGYTFELELKRTSNQLMLMDAALFGDNEKYEEVKKQDSDPVNHPSHYEAHAMESIDEMVVVFGKQAVIDFCKCNAWKYRYRAPYKGKQEEDNGKADWYIKKAKELEDGC